MSFGIIIKGKNQSDRSLRFKPHFNRAIVNKANPHGTMIHTKEQYKEELKKNNLVPYNPEDYRDKKEKTYKPSQWAHDMTSEVKRTKGNPGGAWYAQLEKKGMTTEKLEGLKKKALKYTKGGKDGFQNG